MERTTPVTELTLKIRALNDKTRTSAKGRWVMTPGVTDLPADKLIELMTRVVEYDDFNEDNDPYGEHDFGKITVDHTDYFWKIDYYSTDLTSGSDDPSDPDTTERVLTVMRADEY